MLGFECRRAVVQEPRARHSAMQRHSSSSSKSSTAGAARPGSSKPASTIRAPKGRSQGGRSPRAEPVGQIWRPSTPICSCRIARKLSCLVVPARHNRLADEAGHDDRAGLGLGHLDGAVHALEGPAQASTAACAALQCCSCCATVVEHKEGGQQAHDEQLQQRSGRREGRTPQDRAHEPTPSTRAARPSTINGIRRARN